MTSLHTLEYQVHDHMQQTGQRYALSSRGTAVDSRLMASREEPGSQPSDDCYPFLADNTQVPERVRWYAHHRTWASSGAPVPYSTMMRPEAADA